MSKQKTPTIVITFKNNEHQDITITKLKTRLAKKVYKSLVYQWKHYKAVSIPMFALAVAADTIFYISINN